MIPGTTHQYDSAGNKEVVFLVVSIIESGQRYVLATLPHQRCWLSVPSTLFHAGSSATAHATLSTLGYHAALLPSNGS
jgi:hypothetical protein